jgi:DNA-binding response OmpR family regulator
VEEALRWLPEGGRQGAEETWASEAGLGPKVEAGGTEGDRVLVVDDNADMRDYLVALLSRHWEVEAVADGLTALERAAAAPPDLVLTDVMMPGMDGFELLRALREREATRHVPVVVLSARAGEEATVEGLHAGADDYLVKPFDFDELLARLEALHRRGGEHEVTTQLGSLTVDSRRRVLRCGTAEHSLTAREFALLQELAGHRDEVLTRSRLLAAVWGSDFDGAPNIVDVYVGYLRAKLEQLGAADVAIRTVRGVGFRLVTEAPRAGRSTGA